MARSLLLLRALSSSSRRFTTKSVSGARRILAVFPPEEFRSSSAAESDDKVFLRVLMPGVAREDVDVRVDGNKVVIHGLRRKLPYEETDSDHHCEFGLHRVGLHCRSLNLSDMKAVMKNGILKLVIPKVAEGGGGGGGGN